MTESELRTAVLAAPEDDGPREAYADGIEDDEPERARFIRRQLKLASLDLATTRRDREAYVDLLETVEVAEDLNGSAWSGDVGQWTESVHFRRGFVEEITISGDAYVGHAEGIIAREPVRFARLSSLPPGGLEAVLECRLTTRLFGLDLAGLSIGDAGAEALAAHRNVAGLRWLGLSDTGVRVKGARALARSTHLGHLAFIDSADNPISLTPDPVVGPDWTITGWRVPGGLKLLERAVGRRAWFHGFASTMHHHPPRWYHLLAAEDADG